MAARARKEKDFYAALNRVSSVDIQPKIEKRKRKAAGRLWEVERLVAQRENTTVIWILALSRKVIIIVWDRNLSNLMAVHGFLDSNIPYIPKEEERKPLI